MAAEKDEGGNIKAGAVVLAIVVALIGFSSGFVARGIDKADTAKEKAADVKNDAAVLRAEIAGDVKLIRADQARLQQDVQEIKGIVRQLQERVEHVATAAR